MKIKVLKYENYEADVEYTPNFIERFFGVKSKIKTFVWNDGNYWIDNMKVWFEKETGKKYGRFEEIDDFIRKSRWSN